MFLRRCSALILLFIFIASPGSLLAQQPAPSGQAAQQAPAKDLNDPIERIKDEGMNRSQVMQTLSYLTDVIGPRRTASPNMKRANEWTRDQMTKWGMSNAHLEAWGPFGRGWSLKHFSAQVIEPQAIPLIAYPKAWSPDANIPNGDVVYIDAKNETDLNRFKGNLKGKIVLAGPMREVKDPFDPQGSRLTEKQLLSLADAGDPDMPGAPSAAGNPAIQELIKNQMFAVMLLKFITAEGAALVNFPSC